MAAEKTQNVQDLFLNTARKKKVPVTLYLTHGVKLQGVIGSFDNFSVVLKRGPQAQLVYKHAIASVVPGGPFSMHGEEEGGEAESFAADMEG